MMGPAFIPSFCPGGAFFPCLILTLLAAAGCTRDMYDDSRSKPLEPTSLFENGTTARPHVSNTIARGQLRTNRPYFDGVDEQGNFLKDFPVPITRPVLERGQERYNIYCAPCHDLRGLGHGIVVQRGFPEPLPFTHPKLKSATPGYLYSTIREGYKTMYPMASQIPPADRWAIVAYIQVLQRAAHAALKDVPPEARPELDNTAPATGGVRP